MINENAKLNKKILANKIKQKSIQDLQDEIFRKMSSEKKISLLDDFFRLSGDLQNLNNYKKI